MVQSKCWLLQSMSWMMPQEIDGHISKLFSCPAFRYQMVCDAAQALCRRTTSCCRAASSLTAIPSATGWVPTTRTCPSTGARATNSAPTIVCCLLHTYESVLAESAITAVLPPQAALQVPSEPLRRPVEHRAPHGGGEHWLLFVQHIPSRSYNCLLTSPVQRCLPS